MKTLPSETDVLVVGTGAAGMSSAIRLKKLGLDPILIEKTDWFGGSTAISGGAVWVPCNPHSKSVGHLDSLEAARTYLSAEMGNHMNGSMVDSFLENGPQAVEFLEQNSEVKFAARALGPDYHPDLPGGTLGGRVMDPQDFDARKLGRALKRLRLPIHEFTILRGMMVGRTDLQHLPNMFRSPRSFTHAMRVVWRHVFDLLRFGRSTRAVLGNALAARLGKTIHDLKIPIFYNATLMRLARQDGQRVSSVKVHHNGNLVTIGVRYGVILASGGFAQNETLRKETFAHLKHGQHWSMAPKANTGDGITAAEECGAVRGSNNLHPAFWTPVSRLRRTDGTIVSFPHLFLDRAKPGLIAVTDQGERFVNESASYHDFVNGMLKAQENGAKSFFLVCDNRFVRRYGIGAVRPFPGRIRPFLRSGYIKRARKFGELATILGVPTQALELTIAQYNQNAVSGFDPDFGKGGTEYNRYLGDLTHEPNPCLRPISEGPFYGLQIYTGDIGTSLGLATNEHAQVLDACNVPIPGLYAAGNDMNSVMAGTYPGPGITLGPALTFGFVAANHMASQTSQCSAEPAPDV